MFGNIANAIRPGTVLTGGSSPSATGTNMGAVTSPSASLFGLMGARVMPNAGGGGAMSFLGGNFGGGYRPPQGYQPPPNSLSYQRPPGGVNYPGSQTPAQPPQFQSQQQQPPPMSAGVMSQSNIMALLQMLQMHGFGGGNNGPAMRAVGGEGAGWAPSMNGLTAQPPMMNTLPYSGQIGAAQAY
jgi:hypothetical protein